MRTLFFALALVACSSTSVNPADGVSTGGKSGTGGAAGTSTGGSSTGGSAGVDGAATGGSATCNTAAPWGAREPVLGLNATSGSLRFVGADLLTGYWAAGSTDVDLFTGHRTTEDGAFSGIKPLTSLNTVGAEDAHPSLSVDGLEIFFETNRTNGFHVYAATRQPGTTDFDPPQLVAVVNDGGDAEQPFISGDELFFASSRGGNSDIYVSQWTGLAFQAPMPVPELNTTASENFPVLSLDGLTMYFVRYGATSDADIWTAHRTGVGSPFTDIHAVTELNTATGESATWLSGDECSLYISAGSMFVVRRPAT